MYGIGGGDVCVYKNPYMYVDAIDFENNNTIQETVVNRNSVMRIYDLSDVDMPMIHIDKRGNEVKFKPSILNIKTMIMLKGGCYFYLTDDYDTINGKMTEDWYKHDTIRPNTLQIHIGD